MSTKWQRIRWHLGSAWRAARRCPVCTALRCIVFQLRGIVREFRP